MPRGTKKTPKKKPSARKPRKAVPKAKRNKVEYAKVPKQFEPIFARAQEFVSDYFSKLKGDAREGTIETSGERYLLVRAGSMSVDFFEAIKGLYRGVEEEEALTIARNILFDVAHAIGKADAKSFQKKMKLDDPVEKLSAGPIHFAYCGWAFVDIFPESNPTPDENYFLIYDHPYSFESAAWLKANKKSDCPVCVMNAGYSSGWCEESFGVTLVATEIMCKAAGDDACRFVMAPPSRIDEHVKKYTKDHPKKCKCLKECNCYYEIPGFLKRKQIEKDLRESEEAFRLVFDNANDAILWADPKTGLITNCNKAAEVLLERNRKDIIGRHQTSLHPHDKAKHFAEMFEKHLKDNGAVSEDAEVITASGARKPVEINSSITNVGDKQIIQGIFRDITDRRLREESVRNASIYMDAMPDALVVLNKNAEIVEYNKGALNLIGYGADEKPTLLFEEVVPERELFRYREILAEVFEKGEAPTIEGSVRRKDGRDVPVLISGSPIFDESGRVVKIVCVLKDITQLKNTQEELKAARNNMEQRVELRTAELKRSQKLYQTLAEAAEDFIFIIESDARVRYVNNFGARALQLSKDKIEGQKLSELFPVETSKRMEGAIKQVFASGEAVSTENPFTFPGSEIWLHTHLVPLTNSKGEVTGVMGLARDVTKRREYEERLRLTQTTMDHVSNAIFWLGPDAHFVYVNDQACIQLGYDRAELLRMTVHDIDPNFPEEKWKNHWKDLKEKKSFTLESYHTRKNGDKFPVEIMVNYLEYDSKEYNCAVVLDVTERKKAEEELRKSEERYRRLFENSPVALWEEDFSGIKKFVDRILATGATNMKQYLLSNPNIAVAAAELAAEIDVNQACLDLFEAKSKDELLAGRTRILSEKSAPLIVGVLETIAADKTFYRGEGGGLSLTGKDLSIFMSFAVLPGYEDTYGRVLISLSDITERKLADEALKESERRFQQVAESAEEWIWEVNEHGLYTYSNEVVEEILGYKPEEIVGMMHFYDLFIPEEKEKLKKIAFEMFGKRERFREFVNVNVRKDGNKVVLETSGAPIIDRKGKLVGYRGVDTDVTERKKTEQALRSVLKTKSEFMAMMSHELRTPLTRIISSAHLVLRDPNVELPKKRRTNLSNVLASSDSLLLMINNVLEMARLEGGSVPIYAQDCNLRQMIRTLINSCEGMIGEKELEFETTIDDAAADIYTDKEKLGHILMNLICNGIRYSDQGKMTISAKTSRKSGYVDIAVSDEGIGIPPEKISELFEPFKQLEEIYQRRPGGIGLGLSIVKANLELIGGSIDVKSEVGKGSTFTITIPKNIQK